MRNLLIILAVLAGTSGLACVRDARAQDAGSSTATGISRAMNPAISVNALLLGRVSRDDPSREANNIDIQEMEMQFTSIVDPFWTADLVVAVHPDHGHDGVEAHGYVLDLEVARLEYRNMPRGLGLTIGKDYLQFGKHIPLHTHQFPFVEAPIGVSAFTGGHGLAGVGADLAWTTPLPWYAELQGYAVSSHGEIFDGESRDLVYGGRMSNLWDTSEASTLEFGLSALTGPGAGHGDEPGGSLGLYGADLTWKWVSTSRSQGPAVTFTNEVILPDPAHKEGDPLGIYSILQYRFARQWWLGAGWSVARDYEPHDHDGEEEHGLLTVNQFKGNLTLTPSEFSSVRLEVWYEEDRDGIYQDLGAALQVNFTIGSHPAHLY